MAIQRYCSMKSIKHARMVIGFTVPAFILLGGTSYLIGIVMLAYFYGCDPVTYGAVKTPDQISILMAVKVLSIIPGLPGIFLAAIYAATLSTISGGMNSIAAVLFEDFLKEKYKHWTENEKTLCLKIITTIFGILATGLSFLCGYMGGIYLALMTVLTAATGPLVGLFFLGIFFPKANKNGAFAGVIVAAILMTICSTCNIIEKPYRNYVLPYTQNTGNPNCVGIITNSSMIFKTVLLEDYMKSEIDLHYGDPEASLFSKVSPFSYALISLLIVMIVGHFVSLKFPVKNDPEKELAMHACTYVGRDVVLHSTPIEMPESLHSDVKEQPNMITKFE
uniref:Sodium-coupled monocarboxylate transporter 1 n=1 Tax=Panagrolaimus sp. JU765 TaxID=591449 RepID=A0AC34RLT9_9BILA